MLQEIGEKGGGSNNHWTDVLCADAGGRTLTRSTMKVAYASSPSASQPIAGNSLKNRVVATASRAFVASVNWRLKTSRRWFRASFRACAGGKGFSEEGYRPQGLVRGERRRGRTDPTTAVSTKAPLITTSGTAIARAQCRVADSQSCASIDDCRADKDD